VRNNEDGYIVVETLGTFVPFALMLLGIVMLINVVTMQAKVHYALSQTATEISILSYLDHKAEGTRAKTVDKFEDFVEFLNYFARIFPNANSIARGDLNAYFNFTAADGVMAEGNLLKIFERYMWSEDDQFNKLGLIGGFDGFDFGQSRIEDDGSLVLVVQYDIDYTFTGLLRPITALHVTQTAATKLWRDGNGRGYAHWKSNPPPPADSGS